MRNGTNCPGKSFYPSEVVLVTDFSLITFSANNDTDQTFFHCFHCGEKEPGHHRIMGPASTSHSSSVPARVMQTHSGPDLWISSKFYPLTHTLHAIWGPCHSPHHRSPVGHWRRVPVPPAPQGGPCAGGYHQSTGPVKMLGSEFIYAASHIAFLLLAMEVYGKLSVRVLAIPNPGPPIPNKQSEA